LREALEPVASGMVLAGHTHRATDRRVGPIRAVNLGSVSNPITDDLRATYVILESNRDGHRLTHARVAYDHDAFLAQVDRSGHPERDYIASFQRGDQIRHAADAPGAPATWESL
jgi:hypothetical protein